jgi:hypothetical protein
MYKHSRTVTTLSRSLSKLREEKKSFLKKQNQEKEYDDEEFEKEYENDKQKENARSRSRTRETNLKKNERRRSRTRTISRSRERTRSKSSDNSTLRPRYNLPDPERMYTGREKSKYSDNFRIDKENSNEIIRHKK